MYGIQTGLTGLAGPSVRRLLARGTGSTRSAFCAGLVAAALAQSSTAITLLTIGLANARLLDLPRAMAVVLGANIGTCATVQILSHEPEGLALVATLTGLALRLCSQRPPLQNLGTACLGFGLVFGALYLLRWALIPLKAGFGPWLTAAAGNPLHAVAAGSLLAALLHSSSAATAVAVALVREGLLELPAALALVFGNNVGTCATGLVASLAGARIGRQVAVFHLLLNLAGTLCFLPLLPLFVHLVVMTAMDPARQIANAHTLFNVISGLAALPLLPAAARLLAFVP